MSHLIVVEAGQMATVQDRGRPGLLAHGVSPAGPMDPPLLAIANALLGNPADAAAVEFAAVGGCYRVSAPMRIAIAGNAARIQIDGEPAHAWRGHRLRPGQLLSIGPLQGAVWGYLALSGGLQTPLVLGARATHLRSGLGGLDGRALRAGDVLPVGDAGDGPCLALTEPWRRHARAIRVVPGPQDDFFDAATWTQFLSEPFTISTMRDRMGQVLEGPKLTAARGHDIVSDGTPLGSIQVPGSGKPIVLMAERQTTGGYPKIATVASADLPRLAQLPSGSTVQFCRITQAQAETLAIEDRQRLRQLIAHLGPA